MVVFHAFLGKELFAHVCLEIQLLCSQLHIYKVSFLENLVDLVHLSSLQLVKLLPHFIEKVINGAPNGVPEIELLAMGNLSSVLNHLVKLSVDSLDEVLSSCFE